MTPSSPQASAEPLPAEPRAEAAPPLSLLPQRIQVAGNDLTVFVESGPLIEAMVQDIQVARTRVWLETYIFHNDDCGQAIAAALAERARAGVEVRVLYDAIGSQWTPWAFFRTL